MGLQETGVQIVAPVEIALEFSRVREAFRIRGESRLSLQQECVRCLDPVTSAVTAQVAVLARPHEARDGGSTAEAPDGILYHDGETLTLTDEVRQSILLEIPATPLCRTDCRGLCPRCGANRNRQDCGCPLDGEHDARWAALKGLLADQEAGGEESPGRDT